MLYNIVKRRQVQQAQLKFFAAAQRSFGAAVAVHRREKDYYAILGVNTTATPEQIKQAYYDMVKKYHPDVKASSAPSADMFRNVQEAYSVLSVDEARASYDILRRKNPDAFKDLSEEEFNQTFRPDLRDESGQVAQAKPARGSYAEQRLAELKQQRKQYNVNDLGYYRGGVPRKGKGVLRGDAISPPNDFHQPVVHNYLNNYHQDSYLVSGEDAVKFKAFMASDKADFKRTTPFYPMFYDNNFNFSADRRYWLSLILAMMGGFYLKNRYSLEVDRMNAWDRRENLEDMPAHHFNNRGGVLVKKQFAGFEKYHRNIDDMMGWYKKAYPNIEQQ